MYQLDNLGFNSWFQQEMSLFPKMSKLSLRPTQLSRYQRFFPLGGGVKWQRFKVDHSPLSNVEFQRFDRCEALTAVVLSNWTTWPWRNRHRVLLPSANNHYPMIKHHRAKDFSPHCHLQNVLIYCNVKLGFRVKNFPSQFNLLKSGGY